MDKELALKLTLLGFEYRYTSDISGRAGYHHQIHNIWVYAPGYTTLSYQVTAGVNRMPYITDIATILEYVIERLEECNDREGDCTKTETIGVRTTS